MKVWLKNSLFVLGLIFSPIYATTPAIQEFRLNNGLKLIVKEDHRSPVVIFTIWYKVGGSYEHNGITGISHVLEHMMFRGTQKFPAGKFEKMISEVGGEQNAMTDNDFTMYYELLPANQLPLSFMLEADRMHNALMSEQDFAKEIQVVMEERRMRYDDNPQAVTFERFNAAAFINNPYHHQAIGWMTDLQNMTAKNALDWYKTWYQPNNAIIVVVGDVKPDQVYQLAQKYFGPIPKKEVPLLKPRTEVASLGPIRVDVNLPAQLPFLIQGYQAPTITTTKLAWQPYALDVLSNILGGSSSSRLQNKLIRQQRIATSVQTSYDPFNLHSTLLQIFSIPGKGSLTYNLEKSIYDEIIQLQQKVITPDELQRVKAQMIASKVYSRDSVQDQAMVLGAPEAVGLSWQYGENYINNIDKVTPEQIQQIAKLLLIPKALTVATLHPETMSAQMKPPLNVQPRREPGQ